MKRIKNWRDLLPGMINSFYEWNGSQFRLIKFVIKDDVQKVDMVTSSRTWTFEFDTMETVLLKWVPKNGGYDHLADSSEDMEATPPKNSVVKSSIKDAVKATEDPISYTDQFKALAVTILENISNNADKSTTHLNEAIVNLKGNVNYIGQAKLIKNAVAEQTKADLARLQALEMAERIFKQEITKKANDGQTGNDNEKDQTNSQHTE